MSAAIPDLVWDGFTAQSGMNDGLSRFRLGPTQASLLVNATTRGNFVRQRPGWDRVMTALPAGMGWFQHAGVFKNDAGRVFILLAVAGRMFRVDPVSLSVLEITIPGSRSSSILTQGWSCQAGPFWLYNDGQSPVFIWNGGGARRAGKRELLPGRVIVFVQGRVWYSLPNGREFRAGDLVGNQESGTAAYNYRDSVLKETENTFLNGGGNFSVPSDAGEIVAMRAPSMLDTSLGQGPLLVLCENDGFSVNTPVDRTVWQNVTYPIQTVSLLGAGGYTQNATVAASNDIWFRSAVNGDPEGLRSYMIARREFNTLGNVPQSFEVSTVLSQDQPNLLYFGSSAVYDNRYFQTLSPGYSMAGVYHRGMVVMDLSPMNSIESKAPPVYEGIWTGLKILQLIPTPLGLYAVVLAENGNFDLWKLTKNSKFDNGGLIQWSHIPRALFPEPGPNGTPGRTLKRLETMDLEYDELSGDTTFSVSFAPDSYPCYTEWAEWSECVTTCAPRPTCPPLLDFKAGYQPRKRLPEPPNENPMIPGRPLRNFYTLNLRTNITGAARLLGVRVGATVQQEPKYGPNICDAPMCLPIQCCSNAVGGGYLFNYQAKGSSGTYYSGYDYGAQGYGNPNYEYIPPTTDTGQPKPPLPQPPPTPPPNPPVPGVPGGPFGYPVVNGWQGELGFNGSYTSSYGLLKQTGDIAADGMSQGMADFARALLIQEILNSDPNHPPIDSLVFAWDWVGPGGPFDVYLLPWKYGTGDTTPHPDTDLRANLIGFWRMDAFFKV